VAVVVVFLGVTLPIWMLFGLRHFGLQPRTEPSGTTPAARCEFPTFQPTYLPWLRSGQAVPIPDAFYGLGHDASATLYWSRPDVGVPYYVRLTHQPPTLDGSGPGRTISVAIPGASAGQLYLGETPGNELIYWTIDQGPCPEFVLELSANDMSRAESEAAIIKIARSFRAHPPPAATSGWQLGMGSSGHVAADGSRDV
jgi:hypothetical protein